MVCKKCAAEIQDGGQVCPKCGTKVPSAAQEQKFSSRLAGRGRIVFGVIAGIVVLALVYNALRGRGSDSSGTHTYSQNQKDAASDTMAEGGNEAAYATSTPDTAAKSEDETVYKEITYASGDSYVGQTKNGKREGTGTYYSGDLSPAERRYEVKETCYRYRGAGTVTCPRCGGAGEH